MSLISYTNDISEYAINIGFSLLFKVDTPFEIHICCYHNKVNRCLNYFVCFQDSHLSKAYLVYRTSFIGCTPNESAKKLKIPELDKIYKLTGFNPTELPNYELINFFAEIIIYFDPSQTIGDHPIGFTVPTTLKQLIEQFNSYLENRHLADNYVHVGTRASLSGSKPK